MTIPALDYETYKDKVLAGWIGKSFGGVIGASLECHKELKTLTLEQIWPDKMLPNDDLDLQVVWLEAMQERGIWLTSADLVDFWQDRCWYFFCEYGVFLNNVQRGGWADNTIGFSFARWAYGDGSGAGYTLEFDVIYRTALNDPDTKG